MAYPTIQSGTASGAETSNVTGHPITMPTGVQTGELILVLFAVDGVETAVVNTAASGNNWTRTKTDATSGSHTIAVFWKIAEASNALTVDTTSEMAAFIAYRITGFYTTVPITICTTVATSTTGNMDPPALTPAYGAKDYLWIVFGGADGSPATTAAPGDFSGLINIDGGNGNGATASSAYRQYNTASEYNPGTFTNENDDWLAYTLVVNPTDAGGSGGLGFNLSYKLVALA